MPSSALSGTFSHAHRTGEGDNLTKFGLLPSEGKETSLIVCGRTLQRVA